MPEIEIVNPGATHNRKPLGEVGETVEVSEKTAAAMVRYGLAKPVEDKADEPAENDADNGDEPDADADNDTGENPAEKREKAESNKAAKRETRSN